MERTLIILKPDAVQRGLIGPVITRLEARGLKIVGLKMMHIDRDLARRHYAVHQGKSFFAGLIEYITACPVVVGVVEGARAVQVVRNTMGATNPVEAGPGTIRGDFAVMIGRNLIHGSDSLENAEKEIALFFRPDELYSYERAADPWIFE